MKPYIVTAIDIGEGCDGHARLVGRFSTKEQAEAYVREDMKDVLATMGSDEATIVKWDEHEVWTDGSYQHGCVWDILGDAKAEDNADDQGDLEYPDKETLLGVIEGYLQGEGYEEVVNQGDAVYYTRNGKLGSVYINVFECDEED